MTAEDDLSRRLKEIETERSSRRAERIAETFSPLALCHVCAALVVNPERHLRTPRRSRWHLPVSRSRRGESVSEQFCRRDR